MTLILTEAECLALTVRGDVPGVLDGYVGPVLTTALAPGGLGGLRLPAPRPERPGSPDPLGEVQARTLPRRARKGDPDAAAELVRRGER